ncbi:MAG TPA: cold shock domain-containing protein [Acidimicrobiia bacterium]
MTQGVVKIYDPVTGAGIIVRDDDKSEVYLKSGSLGGSIFRTLRQGQRVVFEIVEEDGRRYADTVRMGQDGY